MPLTSSPSYDFLERHVVLMQDHDASLPCCYRASGLDAACPEDATHGVVWSALSNTVQILPRTQLPLLRDEYDEKGEPPRTRRHPEFCRPHAETVATARDAHAPIRRKEA